MFEKILVCLDGSAFAEHILPYAIEIAARFGGALVLLQVVDMPSIVFGPGQSVVRPDWAERMRTELDKAEDYLARLAAPLRQQGLEPETVALEGIAGETIVAYAEENGVDLVCIATHARSSVGRWVFGSIEDLVLKKSGLPVLAIRTRDTEAE